MNELREINVKMPRLLLNDFLFLISFINLLVHGKQESFLNSESSYWSSLTEWFSAVINALIAFVV